MPSAFALYIYVLFLYAVVDLLIITVFTVNSALPENLLCTQSVNLFLEQIPLYKFSYLLTWKDLDALFEVIW